MDGFIGLVLGISAIFVYFLPTYVAARRIHCNIYLIAFVNLITAWTIIGWLGCLAWAMYRQKDTESIANSIDETTKNCPYCAELIKKKAVFCKHCSKDIEND
ncbi:conserved hypothetical protein [Xenorhabdus bovienii str. oregonense]|uniref:Superinfection immunity protein n=1 Tax=Xenorhabdus bovienii str. oregonense TaxID=1398202 RepID=A0A077NWF6_XENBV|nr:superinfection immunity protein [Xenorhabdus bovienii]CDH06492.1 conserved hypothetical protein [Xenorhabdus bovienii str. oregonense]